MADRDPRCECNEVDIGVGNMREPNPACPVHGAYDSVVIDLLEDDHAED